MKKLNILLIRLSALLLISAPLLTGCDIHIFDFDDEISGDMNIYFGNLHSHTKLSDGKGTPEEALEWARDEMGYDFYAITDHAELLSKKEWNITGDVVESFMEEGTFVPIRGFEYSQPVEGHICVFETSKFIGALRLFHLPWFYSWLNRNDGIGQFNHPGELGPIKKIGRFYNFFYKANVADNMVAIETGSYSHGNNSGRFYKHYIKALDKGWKVAPTNNQDNHKLEATSEKTAVIAEELTYEAIIDALKKRRVYSTDDANMKIFFKYKNYFMGSTVLVSDETVQFVVSVADDEPILKVELITNGGEIVASEDFTDGSTEVLWEPEVEVVNGDYFFVRVTEENINEVEDGDIQISLTSPIWFRTMN